MPKKLDTETGELVEFINAEVRRSTNYTTPFWQTPWNTDWDDVGKRTALSTKDPSKTQQQFAKDADINHILAKFLNTGELNQTGLPIYQDIPGEGQEERDLQTEIVTAYEVEQAWQALPAKVRNTLKDPKTFADYVTHCMQTGDMEPLEELGLANPTTKPEPPKPAISQVVTPDPPTPDKAPKGPIT